MFVPTDHRQSAHPMLKVVAGVAVIIALALLIFAWPAARLEPRDLPIGFVGSSEQAAGFSRNLGNQRGTLDIVPYQTEREAIAGIESREVYGALVPGEQGVRVLTASAASPMVAQLLQNLTAAPNEQVIDVVPGTSSDPRSAAFAATLFPLLVSGTMGGMLTMRLVSGIRERLTALTGAALVSGMVAAGIVQTWLDLLGGNWFAVAGVYALALFAISATIAGLTALWGLVGAGLGAFLVIFLGNAYSGVTSAPELMPFPIGAIGQWLPPGAAGSLLRSVAFFDGSGATTSLAVLVLWSLLGALALLAGAFLQSRSVPRLQLDSEPLV